MDEVLLLHCHADCVQWLLVDLPHRHLRPQWPEKRRPLGLVVKLHPPRHTRLIPAKVVENQAPLTSLVPVEELDTGVLLLRPVGDPRAALSRLRLHLERVAHNTVEHAGARGTHQLTRPDCRLLPGWEASVGHLLREHVSSLTEQAVPLLGFLQGRELFQPLVLEMVREHRLHVLLVGPVIPFSILFVMLAKEHSLPIYSHGKEVLVDLYPVSVVANPLDQARERGHLRLAPVFVIRRVPELDAPAFRLQQTVGD
mmetsp:Transcript_45382/g.119912  ORF Transcript_45382/g.119912 Transcript_45382/m.119912 type:complete len:255 (-) Transcript_45382:232-996(-)